MTTDIKFRLSVSGAGTASADATGFASAIDRIGQASARVAPGTQKMADAVQGFSSHEAGVTTAGRRMADTFASVGGRSEISAKQTAAAWRQVPMQMQDVAVSLAGGMNPMLVAMQQLPQITGAFGGARAAAVALATAVGPVGLALMGVAAAAGAVAAPFYAGWSESKRLADGMALAGNMAGKSMGQINDMVSTVGRSSSVAKGDVRELLTALASSSVQTVETFDSSARAALALSRLNGKTAAESMAAFDGMGDSATTWALKANKAYHFLTAAQFEQIRALEEQGRNQDAARVGLDALAGTLEQRAAPALGTIERSLKSVTNWWSEMWDAAKGIGRVETIEDQLAKAREKLENARAGIYSRDKVPQLEADVSGLERQKASDDIRRADRVATQRMEEDTIARRQAMAALNDRLTGANGAYSKSLRTLHETYQAGELSLDAYRAKVAKLIEVEGGGKEMADKARAAASASVAFRLQVARNAADADLRVQDDLQAQLQHSRSMGLVSERAFAQQSGDIARDRLQVQLALMDKQIAAERAKPVAGSDPAAAIQKQASIKALEGQRTALQAQADRLPVQVRWRVQEIDERELGRVRQGVARVSEVMEAEQMRALDALQASSAGVYQQTFVLQRGQEAWDSLAVKTMRSEAAMLSWDAANQGGNALIEARARALGNLADAQERLNGLQLKQRLDALDSSALQDFASAAEQSFGRVGSALGGLITTLDEYGRKQQELAKLEASIPAEDYAARDRLARQSSAAQVNAYAAMSGAAKSFFKEGSKGYKALEGAEKAFRAVELALAVKTTAEKLGLITAVTGAKVAGDAAQTASTLASVAPAVAAEMAKGQAAAAVGVAQQAQGDPYTAWVRMAAMAATMAALGFAVSGSRGGGGMTAEQRQEQNGTGTVLGDATAKSQSIANSIERLAESSRLGNTYQSGMLASLRNIEASMAGVSTQILRSGGINTGSNLGISEGLMGVHSNRSGINMATGMALATGGPLLAGITNKLFSAVDKVLGPLWGKTKQEITDAGLDIAGSVAALKGGVGVRQFADVQTTSSSWFGLKKDTSNSTVYGDVDQSIAQQFGLIFGRIGDTLHASAAVLGRDGQTMADAVSAYVVNIGKLSLKDLKGDELQEAIATALGAEADQIAAAVLPGLQAFQQIGEGYYETVLRVSSGVEDAAYSLDRLNVSTANFADIAHKQGDVAAEIVRASLMSAEMVSGQLSSVGVLMSTLDGSSDDLATAYQQLVDVRWQMVAVGMSGDELRAAAIRAAGGVDVLSSSLSDYLENFFSDEERTAAGLSQLGQQMAAIGFSTVPASREAFRALAESIDVTTDAGLQQRTRLLNLAGTFADLVPATDIASQSVADYAQNQVTASQTVSNAWSSVWSTIGDEVKRLRGGVLGNSTEGMASLQAQFALASASARANNADAGKLLPGLSKQIDDMALKTASTREEYAMVQARLASSLEKTLVSTGAPAEILQGIRTDAIAMHGEVLSAYAKQINAMSKVQKLLEKFDIDGMPERS